MADSNFIVNRVIIGLYPALVIRDDAIQPLYKKLLDYPEFDGFTSFSPPRAFMDNGTTLGTLTSSSNTLKAELSRSSLAMSWSNAARIATFAPNEDEVVDFITRLATTLDRDIVGAVLFNEYLVKASAGTVEGIFSPSKREGLKNFAATLVYKQNIGRFRDLDVSYSASSIIADAEMSAAFKDHDRIISANTSMPNDPDRVLKIEQIQSFTREVLKAQTGEKLLAELSDGGN